MSNNSQVAHNFAHRTGKHQNGSNMFYLFDDEIATVYSYGTHFAMATTWPGTGINCLLTLKGYSNSTARHLNHVRNAISHLNVLNVPGNTSHYVRWNGLKDKYEIGINNHFAKKDLSYFVREIERLAGKHLRATKYSYTSDILAIVENVKKYVEFFKCKNVLSGNLRKVIFNELNESEIFELLLGKDFQEREDKRREAERLKFKKAIQDFHSFETNYINSSKYTYLRFNSETTTIETSKGVKITELETAKKLYRLSKIAKQKSEAIYIKGEYENTAFRFNGFNVDKIESNGSIFAGCHIVPFNEVLNIGKRLSFDI